MFSEDSDQPAHLHSLIILHHTLYKIHCFFGQIAQTDLAAEMHMLIRVFTECTCYFAEINVICFFSTYQNCEILFPLYIAFLWQNFQ